MLLTRIAGLKSSNVFKSDSCTTVAATAVGTTTFPVTAVIATDVPATAITATAIATTATAATAAQTWPCVKNAQCDVTVRLTVQ